MAAEQPPQQPTREELFRDSLGEVVLILRKLGPKCKSLDDLVGILDLAMSNDSQLDMLIKEIMPLGFNK